MRLQRWIVLSLLYRSVGAGGIVPGLNTTLPSLQLAPPSGPAGPLAVLGGLFISMKAALDIALGVWGATAALGGASLIIATVDDVIFNKLTNRSATVNSSTTSSSLGVVVPSQAGSVGGRGRRLMASVTKSSSANLTSPAVVACPLVLAKLAAFVNVVVFTDWAISLKVAWEATRLTLAVNRAVALAAPRPAPPVGIMPQPPPRPPPMPLATVLASPSPTPPSPSAPLVALQGPSQRGDTPISQASVAAPMGFALSLLAIVLL